MTIQERVEARKDDMTSATGLAQIAANLRKVSVEVDLFQTTARHERIQRWGLNFTVKAQDQAQWGLVTSAEHLQEFMPELRKVAIDLQGIIDEYLAPIIFEIEGKAGRLIGPTVTVHSNGVNVEVR